MDARRGGGPGAAASGAALAADGDRDGGIRSPGVDGGDAGGYGRIRWRSGSVRRCAGGGGVFDRTMPPPFPSPAPDTSLPEEVVSVIRAALREDIAGGD